MCLASHVVSGEDAVWRQDGSRIKTQISLAGPRREYAEISTIEHTPRQAFCELSDDNAIAHARRPLVGICLIDVA